MGGLKKSKAEKQLKTRQDSWQRTVDGKTKGAGVRADETNFHKPGSVRAR